MKYNNIKPAKFINRPNRFIANVLIDGKKEICHVKNTGRCKELLTNGVNIFVEEFNSAKRKTKYDFISIYKGNMLVNIDSQAPNKVFAEFIPNLFPYATLVKAEHRYKDSRFDFYIEEMNRKILVEVKGATLEVDGKAMFPDAPTQRGLKHVNGLTNAVNDGYECYIFFVVQMSNIESLTPNYQTHPEFGEALKIAKANGVNILAYDCIVTKNELRISKEVKVVL